MGEDVGFWSLEESQAFEELIVEAPECFGGIGPGLGHPGFVYLDRARTSDQQTVYWLRHGGIDPHDVRVVEWDGRQEEIEASVRPVPSNMQSTRRGDTVHGRVVMWFALRPGGPAVVELSAEAEPIAGDLAGRVGCRGTHYRRPSGSSEAQVSQLRPSGKAAIPAYVPRPAALPVDTGSCAPSWPRRQYIRRHVPVVALIP